MYLTICSYVAVYINNFVNLPLQQQHHEHTTQSGSCKEPSSPRMTSPKNIASKTFNKAKKSCSAFLIGAGSPVSHSAVSARRSLDRPSTKPLDGVLKDLSWMNIFMNDRKIPVYEVMLDSQHTKQNKSNLLKAFENFFNQKGIKRFVIYYSGHGCNGKLNTNKGDWCFETSGEGEPKIIFIGLNDILELWDQMTTQCGAGSCTFKDRYLLFIIADSCFSGIWVEEIKKRPRKKTPSGESYRDVHMIASCLPNETSTYSIAYGGDFTRRYITADSSKHNLRDTTAHLAKLAVQSVIQGATFPLYMPVKGLANYYNSTSHGHTPIATNEKEEYRMLLMKYDGKILPIGKGLGIASGWSWMLSGQIFHN